jgi:hypothetical protein
MVEYGFFSCVPCLRAYLMHTYHLGMQNVRKGDFCRAKVKGKRCIELGAGMVGSYWTVRSDIVAMGSIWGSLSK